MIILASPYSKMSRAKGRSSGWAAFDLNQRQKQGNKPELDMDPYPPMPNIISGGRRENFVINNNPPKSFASVVQPSLDFPSLMDNSKNEILVDNYSRKFTNRNAEEASIIPTLRKLKMLHSWADESLIEDTLAAVNSNEDEASILLKAMVSSDSEDSKSNLSRPDPVPEGHLHEDKVECVDQGVSENQSANSTHLKLISGQLFSVPVEPEWEEDDVYISHRKDAMRMMRLASQHSRAASNAFIRGDHLSAQELSMKARSEWMGAEKLNAKAAKEILYIRNSENDTWKLDLHGLHASEAVQALQEHLHSIETQMPMNCSVSSDGLSKPLAGIVRSPSVEFTSCLDMDAKADKQYASSRERPTALQVITGSGNHSRGQAALPTAVRSFLIENGYRFDDARPGVLSVQPKFRHRATFGHLGCIRMTCSGHRFTRNGLSDSISLPKKNSSFCCLFSMIWRNGHQGSCLSNYYFFSPFSAWEEEQKRCGDEWLKAIPYNIDMEKHLNEGLELC
ncbi:smr (Small MutS Related) domain-containing protein isoform X2 [Tasmannia lanceolata]|uniref:smr (Small MutS Related) domain-containing protein isoform X2 n=1 Tax=Tasmannia lanceolata TaxID=3420 RepID=UPI004063CF0E